MPAGQEDETEQWRLRRQSAEHLTFGKPTAGVLHLGEKKRRGSLLVNPGRIWPWNAPAQTTTQDVWQPPSLDESFSANVSAFFFEDDMLTNHRVVLLQFNSLTTVCFIFTRRICVASSGRRFQSNHRSLITFRHQTFSPRRLRSANTDSIPRLLMILMPFALTVKVT